MSKKLLSHAFPVLTVIGLMAGVWALLEIAAQKELAAIATIQDAGGTVLTATTGWAWLPRRYRYKVVVVTLRDPFATEAKRDDARKSPSARQLSEALSTFSSLESLSLSDSPLQASDLLNVRTLASLQSLYVSQAGISDRLHFLAACTELDTLQLNAHSLSGEQIHSLRHLQKLRSLDITCWDLTDDDLLQLPPLGNLEVLKITAAHLDGRCVRHLNSYAKLHTLELSRSPYEDILEEHFSEWFPKLPGEQRSLNLQALDMPALHRLRIEHVSIDKDSFQTICSQLGIEELSLQGTDLQEEWLALLRSTKLRFLNVSNTATTKKGLAAIAQLPALEELQLVDTQVCAEDLSVLHAAGRLHCLRLGGLDDYKRVAWHLSQMRSLTTLDVSDWEISEAEMAALLGVRQLQFVIVNGTIRRGK